jgi:hypothetical protein
MEDRNLSITLPVAAWNVVMNALGQRPFAEVAELISEIKKQAEKNLGTNPAQMSEATE